jgi:hypothetical protein
LEEAEVKKIVDDKAKWYIHYFGLGNWSGKIVFSEAIKEDRWGFVTHAETSADWKYLRFTITVFVKALVDYDEDYLEEVVVHELMHVFLNEVREAGIDHEERVATSLQKAFSWFETAIRRENEEEVRQEIENEKEEHTHTVELNDHDRELLDLLKGNNQNENKE